MRLAQALGLDVRRVWMRYVPEPVYIVERFDRTQGDDAEVRRLHIIDTCQLLNRDRAFKFTGANIQSLNGAISLCRSKIATRLNLFRWLIFNVLTGNGDNHLKNVSFIVDHEGLQLAPAYDLLATAVYDTPAVAGDKARWPASELALQVSEDHQLFGNVSREELITAGIALGLNEKTASREISRQTDVILETADTLLEKIRAEHQQLVDSSPNKTEANK